MTPVNLAEAAALLCFVGAGIAGICAVIVGGRKSAEIDQRWEDAERRRAMLTSQFTADIQALEVKPEAPAVTQAKRELMEEARWGR